MAFLAYGAEPGDPNPRLNQPGAIRLEIVDTREVDKRPVFRGPDYLYTEVDLRVSAVYSPQATSYTHDGVNPVRGAGALAPVTETAVRHYLSQGQRQLVYRVGNSDVVVSPRANRRIDAANGPFPTVHNVTLVSGWKTFLIDFSIRTYLNEDFLQTGNPPIVLSHRWKRERDVDQDHFSTLVTTGEAVFNTDRLDQLALSPDDLWDAFAHPIENGFRRNHIQVTVAEDGASLHYCTIDREMPLTVTAQGVSRVEAYHTATVGKDHLENVAAGAIPALLNGDVRGLINPLVSTGLPGFGVLQFGAYAVNYFSPGTIPGLPRPTIMKYQGAVPWMRHHLVVRIWGNANSSRATLEQVAQDLILRRIDQAIGQIIRQLSGFESSTSHDVAGRFVEVSVTFVAPPLITLSASQAGLNPAFNNLPFAYLPADMDVQDIFSTVPGTNPKPPGGDNATAGGTRGTYLGALVAQVLKTPATEPDPPQPARNFQPQG